jgi:hypothetical protein
MAETDDRRNLAGDLNLPQRRVLLELSSRLPDIVPSREIALAGSTQSNDAINDTINNIPVSFTYRISAA